MLTPEYGVNILDVITKTKILLCFIYIRIFVNIYEKTRTYKNKYNHFELNVDLHQTFNISYKFLKRNYVFDRMMQAHQQ